MAPGAAGSAPAWETRAARTWDPRALAEVHLEAVERLPRGKEPSQPLRFKVRLSRAVAAPVSLRWQAGPPMASGGAGIRPQPAGPWPSGEVSVPAGRLETFIDVDLPRTRPAAAGPVQVLLSGLRGPALPAVMHATAVPIPPPPAASAPSPPAAAQRAADALSVARRIDALAGPALTPEGQAARDVLAQSQAALEQAVAARGADEPVRVDLPALRRAMEAVQQALGLGPPREPSP